MTIRVDVTEEERELIRDLAERSGQSMSAFILDKVLYADDPKTGLLKFTEQQAAVAQDLNDLVTTAIQNKVIYEEQVLELLHRMTELERITAAALKEVSKHGHSR